MFCLFTKNRNGFGIAWSRKNNQQIAFFNGGGTVVAYTKDGFAQMHKIHSQNADDIARAPPTGGKHTRSFQNCIYQGIQLSLLDSQILLLDIRKHFFSSFCKVNHISLLLMICTESKKYCKDTSCFSVYLTFCSQSITLYSDNYYKHSMKVNCCQENWPCRQSADNCKKIKNFYNLKIKMWRWFHIVCYNRTYLLNNLWKIVF